LSPKNGPLGQCQGPGKDGQDITKTPLLMTFLPENLKPKMKHVFFDVNSKTCWIRRGFEQFSSSSGWQFMAKKRAPINWHARLLRVNTKV